MARTLEGFLKRLSVGASEWDLQNFLYEDDDIKHGLPEEHLGEAVRANFKTFIAAWKQGKQDGNSRILGLARLDLSQNHPELWGVEEWKELGTLLRDSSITELNLSEHGLNALDDNQWAAFCNAIKTSKVKTLRLRSGGKDLTAAKWNMLGDALESSLVTSLDVTGLEADLEVGSAEWPAFVQMLQKSHIQRLGSFVRDDRIVLISLLHRILDKAPYTLERGNPRTDRESEREIERFGNRNNPAIIEWIKSVASDGLATLTDPQFALIGQLLKIAPSNTKIALPGNVVNTLQVNDWKIFFESIKETSIDRLTLEGNQLSSLDEESFQTFCEGLKDSSIVTLDLQQNALTESQRDTLLEALKESHVEALSSPKDDALQEAFNEILAERLKAEEPVAEEPEAEEVEVEEPEPEESEAEEPAAEAAPVEKEAPKAEMPTAAAAPSEGSDVLKTLDDFSTTKDLKTMIKQMDGYQHSNESQNLAASLFDLYKYFAKKTLKSSTHQDRWKHFKESIMNELAGQESGKEHFPGIDKSLITFRRGWAPWSKGEYLEKLRAFEKSFNALGSQNGERTKIIKNFNESFLQDGGLLHPEKYIKESKAPRSGR